MALFHNWLLRIYSKGPHYYLFFIITKAFRKTSLGVDARAHYVRS